MVVRTVRGKVYGDRSHYHVVTVTELFLQYVFYRDNLLWDGVGYDKSLTVSSIIHHGSTIDDSELRLCAGSTS